MTTESREQEQALAAEVQLELTRGRAVLRALCNVNTDEWRPSKVERKLIMLADTHLHAREILACLHHHVNAFWAYAVEAGLVRRIAASWYGKHPHGPQCRALGYGMDEVQAEVALKLRPLLLSYKPGKGSLVGYAKLPIGKELSTWLRSALSPASGTRKEAYECRLPARDTSDVNELLYEMEGGPNNDGQDEEA